ncbi:MAG: peptidylprolyl isomerase [Calditrichaeota bacterium]|nr:peptidylprolyl isomerase [Calditrichota bacterium]
MKRILVFSLLFLILTGCGRNPQPSRETVSQKPKTAASSGQLPADTGFTSEKESVSNELTPPTLADVGDLSEVAVITTTKGDIVVEFFADKAPMHIANFKKLARYGFYDGTTFHRVLPGFVIQGGDPNSKDANPENDGSGGPPWKVNAEFNDVPHEKGILSMARSPDFNSAGSQFFICLGRAAHLDNKYTVFGRVIRGLDVVEKIGENKRDPMSPHDRMLPAVIMTKVQIIHSAALPPAGK